MRFTYVFDGYCGWCYGFADAVAELAAQSWADVRVISGGLFPRDSRSMLSQFPHIPVANDRISALTGAVFGDAYRALVEDGTFIMDSDASALGLSALKRSGGNDLLMAHAMQEAFYLYGRDLADAMTYERIADAHGLDPSRVRTFLGEPSTLESARAEQAEVARMGVSAYPTLLAHSAQGTFRLGGPATSGPRLIELARAVPGGQI